jgi:hypothetical protein
VPDLPEGLAADLHLGLRRRWVEPWVRRLLIVLFVVGIALGLANIFGQRSTTSAVAEPAAELTVTAPARIRGGLLGQGEIHIDARRRIARPRIVLERGWVEGVTINTIAPEPADQDDAEGGSHSPTGSCPPARPSPFASRCR